jgi:hypothetical protein
MAVVLSFIPDNSTADMVKVCIYWLLAQWQCGTQLYSTVQPWLKYVERLFIARLAQQCGTSFISTADMVKESVLCIARLAMAVRY